MEKIADLTCLTEYQGCVRKGTCVAIIFLALAFSLGSSKSVNILNLMEPTAYFTVEKKELHYVEHYVNSISCPLGFFPNHTI